MFNVQECCSHYHFSVCLFFVLTGLIVTLQVKEKYCQVITRCCLHAHTQTQTLITATICLVLTELCLLVNKYFISTSPPSPKPGCLVITNIFLLPSLCVHQSLTDMHGVAVKLIALSLKQTASHTKCKSKQFKNESLKVYI